MRNFGTHIYKLITLLSLLLAVQHVASTGPSAATYTQSEPGAVSTAVQDGFRQRMSTIKEFGAVCDGTTADDGAFALVAVLRRSVIIPRSTGACRLTANVTVPANVELFFEAGGQITVDVGRTLTIASGVNRYPIAQLFAGSGAVLLTRAEYIRAEWFGAVGDGSTNNATAIQKAVDAAQDSGGNPSVRFAGGIFSFSSTINVIQSNAGITFSGPANTAMMQGSAYPVTTLRWTGGSSPMFTIGQDHATRPTPTSYVNFHDLAIENTGTATMWLNIQLSGNVIIRRVVVTANPPTSAAFSTALIRSMSNIKGRGGGLNYSTIEASEFNYAAPVLFKYDNQGAANSYTWIHFDDNLVNADANMSVFEFIDGGGKLLRMQGNTFNSQPARGAPFVLTALEMTGIGPKFHLDNLVFRDNEVDDSGGTTSASRILKLRNVHNADITNNNFVGNGSNTSMIDVRASDTVTVCNSRALSINGPLVTTQDATSRVVFCPNNISLGNVAGLINNTTTGAGLIDIAATVSNVIVEAHKGLPSGHTVFRFDARNNRNYTVTLALPGETVPSYPTRGQIITVMIRNTSGGAMGAITFNPSYKTAGAFTVPANGNSRSLTCVYDGTHCVEVYRTTADVAN